MFLETMKLGLNVLNQTQVLSFVFRLIFSAVFFMAGFLVVFYLKAFLLKCLRVLKVDFLADKLGMNKLVAFSGLHKDFVEVLLNIFYWVGLVLFFILALALMYGDRIVDELTSIIIYSLKTFSINVFVSVFIIVLGILLAQFIGYIVKVLMNIFNIPFARFVVLFAKATVLINALLRAFYNVGLITSLTLAIDIIGVAFVVLLTIAFLLAINNQFLKITNNEEPLPTAKPVRKAKTTTKKAVKAKK